MIIIISPSKTFKDSYSSGGNTPVFLDKQKILLDKITYMDKTELQETFNLSNKLTDEVFSYYHGENKYGLAIDLYDGVLYKALKQDSLNFKDNSLYIISAFYGLLKHDDLITKYRLDFTVRRFGSLYQYWQDDITNYLNTTFKDEIIVNLTSKEFYPVIKDVNQLITIEFAGTNKKRLNSVLLKQLRGTMARLIINQNIQTKTDLKDLSVLGFKYDVTLSNENVYYFSQLDQ